MLQIYKKSPRETSVFSSFCAAGEDIFRFVYNSLLAAPECARAPLECALAVPEHALKMVGAIRSSRKGIQSVLRIQSVQKTQFSIFNFQLLEFEKTQNSKLTK